MGDELDDLFGAFDDLDEQQPELESATTKRSRTSNNDVDADCHVKQPTASNPTAAATTSAAATSLTTTNGSTSTSFHAVMAQRPIATQQQPPSSSTATAATTKSTDNETTPREIATGTSHDKSVRSYTAHPKNIPPGLAATKKTAASLTSTLHEPAKTYPFTLDPFQQQAVGYIDKNESVLVAAHTSAGKTAVAEYAVAKSLKLGQRVVYTSPIKALSNQKFRDLQEEFHDVGLMTGDITINPDATALVMTTEILRSMLYRGSELIREVAWVIYDEVHYMRDAERGVVWEESIILLPHSVRFVFLSATIPNASQFAEWIASIHHQTCHVVYTNYRPVPLQHYIFPQGGEGLHLVVDERGNFREANFQKAMATLQSNTVSGALADAMMTSGGGKKRGRTGGSGPGGGKRGGGGAFTDLLRIVKLIMQRNLNPVIIFSFSKKDCERYALALNDEDYTDDVEKDLISQVYNNAIESLSDDDRKLPQIQALLPLLKRGIGIHHGGLLPILKEIVEILFSEGLIKVLFATETFSIGINMPAKTVVFTNTRKWDGRDFRWVSSGEYIQMSGRAGRRGKDDRGIVIQMLDEKMEPAVCKDILYGAPDPLNSSYRISYNMLLNLMRVEDVDPEYLLRASFHQFQKEQEAPALIAKAIEFEQKTEQICFASPEEEEMVAQYYQMDHQLLVIRRNMAQILQKPEHILKFLQQPGRFLNVTINGENYGWGVLSTCKKKPISGSAGEAGRITAAMREQHTLEVLLECIDRHFDDKEGKADDEDLENVSLLWRADSSQCRPVTDQDRVKRKNLINMRLFAIGLEHIDQISAVRVHVPQEISLPEARQKLSMSVAEVKRRLAQEGGIPLLDPKDDMGIHDENFHTQMKRAEVLTERMASHKLATDYGEEQRQSLVHTYQKKTELAQQAKAYRDEARKCETMVMKDELKRMKRVLKKLGHVDSKGVIQTKGRTACEVNTADELIVVEMIFAGVFSDLSVEQCVALLSCMTFDERNKDEDATGKLKIFLSKPFFKLQEIARTVVRVKVSCGIELDEDQCIDQFNPGMMEPVYAWCKGVKFIEVQALTNTFEGTTIRTLRRLEELVRQIAVAAKAIGNFELQTKFEKGGELLRRDIVFCSSLYL